MDSKTIERLTEESELMRDAVNHLGFKLLADKLRAESRKTLKKQLDADPYTEADTIQRCKQFRYVVNVMLPSMIEGLVNFDPGAPDKMVPPKRRFSVVEWIKKMF